MLHSIVLAASDNIRYHSLNGLARYHSLVIVPALGAATVTVRAWIYRIRSRRNVER